MADDELTRIGHQLAALATAEQRAALERVQARSDARRLRVLIAGEAKRGKSTLINRLLGRDLLPVGALPVTAISTTVRPGEREQLMVRYLDGRTELRTVEELAELVTEQHNPHNRRAVAEVDVVLADPTFADRRVELVDTPGTGSVFEHNTTTARDSYRSLDAVILVVAADPPINAAERELLAQLSDRAVHTFVVLNKADLLSPDDLEQTVAFTVRVCTVAALTGGQIYPMSARDADAGLSRFRADFDQYLTERGQRDAVRAARRHVLDIAEQMREQTDVEAGALRTVIRSGTAGLSELRDRLATLTRAANELDDRCRTTGRRLRRQLDGAAREQGVELAAGARDHAGQVLAALPAGTSADRVEQDGRAAVEAFVTDGVLRWRDAQAALLQAELARLVDSVERDRLTQLTAVRDLVADELGVTVRGSVQPLPLEQGEAFWLDFSVAPRVELPGTQSLAHHLPGAAHRSQRTVLAEAGDLADRQVGRVRADLQHRLGQTLRQVLAALRRYHHETVEGLQTAAERAADAAASSQATAGSRAGELEQRLAALAGLCAQLTEQPEPT